MTKKEYFSLYLLPEWQKKRLEILQRDNFTCCYCNNDKEELHLHHIKYEWGKKPWEYVDSWFKTLCKTCHQLETEQRGSYEHDLIVLLAQADFTYNDLDKLCCSVLFQPEELKKFIYRKPEKR